jgi:hypothetical protein
MSDKGIIVGDAASGSSVALRQAVEEDGSANTRYIQLVDHASRKIAYENVGASLSLGSMLTRTITKRTITSSDPLTVANESDGTDDICDSVVYVGDCTHLNIWGAITPDSVGAVTGAEVVIIPFIAEVTSGSPNTMSMVAPFPPFRAVPIAPAGTYGDGVMLGGIGGFFFPLVSVPVCGAEYMGFAVYLTAAVDEVVVWASTSSQGYKNQALETLVAEGEWGGVGWDTIGS